jgi:FtsH-binding integral membrane protein
LFELTGITPPNHWGYVHFAAGLLLVFGLMFRQIASDPARYRVLIPYGILLKVTYVGTVAWHWLGEGLPGIWKIFAGADLVFLILFVATYRTLDAEPDAGRG